MIRGETSLGKICSLERGSWATCQPLEGERMQARVYDELELVRWYVSVLVTGESGSTGSLAPSDWEGKLPVFLVNPTAPQSGLHCEEYAMTCE